MTGEQQKATTRRLIEETWNRGNLAAADELLAEGFVYHRPPPGVPPTRDGFKQAVLIGRQMFPDLRIAVEDAVVEGDRVAIRYTLYGTQQGPFMGLPPTNKPVTITGMVFFRFSGDWIAERWENADDLGLLQQLGLVPTPRQ